MSTPTQFKAFLNTNYTPSELEVPLLKEIIAKRKAEADALALKIEQMEKVLSLLKDQRVASLKDMEEHLALLSSSRWIPFEVLESIFQACLPGTESGPAGISSPYHPSVSLSRVCRSWRSTALGCPKLWAEPRIVLPSYERALHSEWMRKMGKLVQAFNVWIERSGNMALTMLVDSADCPDDPLDADGVNNAYSTLIQAIKKPSARWRELTLLLIVGPNCDLLLDVMRFTSASLPLLEKASLQVSSASTEWDVHLHRHLQGLLTSSGLFSTPTVRSLTLRGVWGDTCAPATMNLWPPLTSLNMDCHYPSDAVTPVMSVFQIFHHLCAIPTLLNVSFFIQGRSSSTNRIPVPHPTAPLEIPNLESLMLMGARIPKGFGPFLKLPALENLHLQFRNLIPEGIESGLVECILHFGAQLKSLTFCPDAVSRRALVKILESLPRIETLILDSQGSGSRFTCSAEKPGVDCYAITELNAEGMDVIGVSEDSVAEGSLRCPQLRRLRLRTTGDRYEDDSVEQALVELIARRRGRSWASGEFRLQEVSVTFQRERRTGTPDILQELKEWNADLHGFTLHLAYP